MSEGFSHKSEKREKVGDGSLIKICEIIKDKEFTANKIEVSSNIINVRTFSTDKNEFIVKLIGSVAPKAKVDLKVENINGNVKVDLNTTESSRDMKYLFLLIGIPNYNYRSIRFNTQEAKVCVNSKCKIDFLEVKTKSGEIIIGNVSAEGINVVTKSGEVAIEEWNTISTLMVNSKNGEIYCHANASYINCNSSTGNIELILDANKDMEINLNSKTGNIDAKFSNLERLIAEYESECGFAQNSFTEDDGEYIVNLNANSFEGDVDIENN